MRFSITVVNAVTGARRDVLVDADPDTPLGDLLPVLQRATGDSESHPGFARRIATWVDGREVDPTASLRSAGVAPGVTLALHEQDDGWQGPPDGVVELRIVSGPGAGRVRRFGIGDYTIGCGSSGLSLPDLKVPVDALRIRVTTSAEVEVLACTEPVLLDGRTPGSAAREEAEEAAARAEVAMVAEAPTKRKRRKAEKQLSKLRQKRREEQQAPPPADVPGELDEWPASSDLRIGDTLLQWRSVWHPDSDTSPSEDRLGTDFNRPPRLLPPTRETSFVLPADPGRQRRVEIPWPMVVSPLFMVIPMYFWIGPRALMFAVLTPVMALFNYISQRRGTVRDYRERMDQFEEDDLNVRARVRDALIMERHDRVEALPDAAELLLHAIGPGSRLWARRRTDPDYLFMRLGVADRPTEITIRDRNVRETDEPPPPRQLGDVPVGMSLTSSPVVGLTGSPDGADAIARWLCGQAAVLHAPADLRIVVLTTEEREEQWSWVRWLPHCRVENEPVVALVGIDQESVSRRIGELGQLIDQRAAREPGQKGTPPPDYLVVLDGARRLRSLPGVVSLLRQGPESGIAVLCLDEDERSLPEECRAVLTVRDSLLEFRRAETETVTQIRPDLVEPAWSERIGRSLAPLRDTTPSIAESGLPASARLLECIGLPDPTPALVAGRWGPEAVTDVVIGAGYDGNFRLDVRRDGPHALIAGTTGSGKSELLQSLVASLAVANRPDQLTFVLVDYKGGSAFKDCARLPHTVGMVTDLDTHLVGRALTSLGAELKRREHLLSVPGAKDLEDYWALQRTDAGLPTIPRLLIVIDEFASLKAELPDFVTGLVTIAQRGRSLGIHLVLATQRPSGVISNDIRANTNLRIALRVTDESESRDVIDAPDSAGIAPNQPGRGFARLGASTLLPFQAGRVGGARPGVAASQERELPEPLAWPVPWARVGAAAPARPAKQGQATDEGETDLKVLVEAIQGAVAQAAIPPPHAPWLPELPTPVTLAELRERDTTPPDAAPVGMGVPWVLEDVPAEQAQRVRRFVLGRSGHLQVIGGPRSGRSTALRTIAAGLAETTSPRDLHVYGLDCGNGALLPLTSLPHTGAVVQRVEVERAGRLLDRLGEEVSRRQAVLGASGFADVDEQRRAATPDERLPYVLLVLDRWEGFLSDLAEVDLGRLNDRIFSLLREGASVGVHVVMSGDRNLLNGRVASLVEHRLVLRLPDRSDFSSAGLRPKDVPDHLPEGRGLWGESGVEAQIATLGDDVSGAAQSEAVRELGRRLSAETDPALLPPRLRPFRLEALPVEIRAEDALAGAAPLSSGQVPVAMGGDDLTLISLEAVSSPVLLVGPPRSGRTNGLAFMVRHAEQVGREVLGFTPVPNQLTELLGERAVVGADADPEEVVSRLRGLAPGALVVVDDAGALRDGPLAPVMVAIIRQAREKELSVAIAGGPELGGGFSGWLVEARKGRKGMVLSPQEALAGDVFGGRVARTSVTQRIQPGRGVLFTGDGDQVPVQVPLVAVAGVHDR